MAQPKLMGAGYGQATTSPRRMAGDHAAPAAAWSRDFDRARARSSMQRARLRRGLSAAQRLGVITLCAGASWLAAGMSAFVLLR